MIELEEYDMSFCRGDGCGHRPTAHLWALSLTSYRGISIGAEHYYATLGKLRTGERIRVEHVLTAPEARALTEKDHGFRWNVGDETNRFDTEADARAAGIVVWRSVAGGDDALLEGDTATCDPQPCLSGPEAFRTIANRIAVDAEKSGWWEGSVENMEALGRHWDLIVAHYGFDQPHNYVFAPGSGQRELVVERDVTGWKVRSA